MCECVVWNNNENLVKLSKQLNLMGCEKYFMQAYTLEAFILPFRIASHYTYYTFCLPHIKISTLHRYTLLHNPCSRGPSPASVATSYNQCQSFNVKMLPLKIKSPVALKYKILHIIMGFQHSMWRVLYVMLCMHIPCHTQHLEKLNGKLKPIREHHVIFYLTS